MPWQGRAAALERPACRPAPARVPIGQALMGAFFGGDLTRCGEVPERSNGAVSKTVVPLRVPRVRIPPSPPFPRREQDRMKAIILTGGCRCGAVSYELSVSGELPVYCCHCLDCQKWSGSAFAEQAPVAEDAVRTTGPVARAQVTSRQGRESVQYVCGICHSRIYSTNPSRPGAALVRAGTLDETTALRPRAHIWVRRKQPWLTLPNDVQVFEENPSPEQFKAVIKGEKG
jgi:hypothetical protein